MIKKTIAIILLLMLMSNIVISSYAYTILDVKKNVENLQKQTIQKFSDVKEDSWFLKNVALLTGLGVINGYSDNTFKPSEKVTKAQFIKMVIVSLGHVDIMNDDRYWARPYISKARELGIMPGDEPLTSAVFDVPISRSEMAKIITNAIRDEGQAEETSNYIELLNDYDIIPILDRNSVLIAYSKGILTGYEDGEFKPQNNLTRAEAATVLVRMLDKEERKPISY